MLGTLANCVEFQYKNGPGPHCGVFLVLMSIVTQPFAG